MLKSLPLVSLFIFGSSPILIFSSSYSDLFIYYGGKEVLVLGVIAEEDGVPSI